METTTELRVRESQEVLFRIGNRNLKAWRLSKMPKGFLEVIAVISEGSPCFLLFSWLLNRGGSRQIP